MTWRLFHDLDDFLGPVRALLGADPAEHTLPLSIVEQLRTGPGWSRQPPLFGLLTGGGRDDIRGAVLMTPPHNLLLALLPSGSAAGLAAALAARGTAVPGLYGTPEATAEFAAAWREVAGIGVAESSERRLYVLEKLRPPDPLPAGAARAAGSADLDVVARWFADFEAEAHGGPAREDPDLGRARQRERVETGHVWLWEDPAGTVVSMAGRQPTVAGVARVGPVYTPPPERRRGYGAAVTAACTTAALAGGAEHVVLFTDLANPTSNAIYQQIGFRPRSDRREVTFAS